MRLALALALLGSSAAGAETVEAIAPTEAPPSSGLNLGGRDVTPLTGLVKVRGGDADVATLALPEGYLYFAAADAQHIVEKLWGNPPDPTVHGLVMPPVADGDDEWGIVVSYDPSGHVDDGDAGELDFANLLADMQKDAAEANPARRQAGYAAITLKSWAEPPRYDASARKLYWARALQFEGSPQETLNYDVRILGRQGVLLLSAVSSVRMLPKVSEGCRALLAVTEFTDGHRYAQFDPAVDALAPVGVGGLIAGKVLAKPNVLARAGRAAPMLMAVLLVAALGVVLRLRSGRERPRPAPDQRDA